jgi:hypothetical protein
MADLNVFARALNIPPTHESKNYIKHLPPPRTPVKPSAKSLFMRRQRGLNSVNSARSDTSDPQQFIDEAVASCEIVLQCETPDANVISPDPIHSFPTWALEYAACEPAPPEKLFSEDKMQRAADACDEEQMLRIQRKAQASLELKRMIMEEAISEEAFRVWYIGGGVQRPRSHWQSKIYSLHGWVKGWTARATGSVLRAGVTAGRWLRNCTA